MEVCTGGRGKDSHPEIVHDERYCPLCDMRDDLMGQISVLEAEIEELKKEA